MPKKLLVVEDSKTIAGIIEKIAQSLNFDVTLASSLEAVKKTIQENDNFFAATVDYALPDAPHGEAIPYVLSKGIPSIVLTGMMDESTRQKILSQPVIDYIPKENNQAFVYLKRILKYQLTNSIYGILVVDDSLSSRNHIVELLKRRNFTVYTATQGEEALEVLSNNIDIKMVITDLEMPVMDGITLSNEIRRKYAREQLAIIGISGAVNGIHSARFIKNGADDFLRKPFCPEEFYCRITQNIDNLNNIQKIQHAANTDYLTELPNRRAFFTHAEPCVQEYIKSKTTYCVAIFDIDFFKKVNDVHGHDAGDHILKVFSLYLRKHLGIGILSRLGGEEFSVVLSGGNKRELYIKIDQFREKVANYTVKYADKDINYSVSIGVVFNSQKTLTQQMIEADTALYFAKENGRNRVAVADKI
jgi:diguanylate cyclase (GGDEF)-like protein